MTGEFRVLRTLYGYLSRDLLKVAGMALVAFTLVMTVFAIIEPLRKQGLGSGQVAPLFLYTLPMMLSLTMPIASLFAATIVYGRFSQDNELTACRASGVSTIGLLKPAMALGAVVTVCAMLLSNFVAPKMTELLGRSIKANVMTIVARKLRTRNFIKMSSYRRGKGSTQIIHADAIAKRGNKLTLYGVVASDGGGSNMDVLVASKAHASFITRGSESYVTVLLNNPVLMRTSDRSIVREKDQPFFYPVPDFAEEKPSWYNWNKLIRARSDPLESSEIRGRVNKIRRDMLHDMFARDAVKLIKRSRPYGKLSDEKYRYVVRAPSVKLSSGSVELSSVSSADGMLIPVTVSLVRGGRTEKMISANSGRIWSSWNMLEDKSFVNIKLTGSVKVGGAWGTDMGVQRRPEWSVGKLAVPDGILARAERVTAEQIYRGDKIIGLGAKHWKELKTRIEKLQGKVLAEIHSRLAYGLSCFLLVGIGSALGLWYRGGQILSAFTISVVPGAMVIVLILMGKRIISNPAGNQMLGVGVVWGGIAALAIAQAVIYFRLSRR